MTRSSPQPFWVLAVVLVLVVSSCGSSTSTLDDPDGAATVVPEPVAAQATETPLAQDPASVAASADPECESAASAMVEPWEELDAAAAAADVDGSFSEIANTARQRTSHLTEPSRESCDGFAIIERDVDAATFGAVAYRSFEHANPPVRFDFFVYSSAGAADAAGARELIRAEHVPSFPAGNETVVSKLGPAIFYVTSFAADDDAALDVVDYYGQRIAGFE